MKQTPPNGTAEQHVREIRRQTRKKYSSEEKIRIVLDGLHPMLPRLQSRLPQVKAKALWRIRTEIGEIEDSGGTRPT